MLLSAIMMLKHLGWIRISMHPLSFDSCCSSKINRLHDHATRIETAIYNTVSNAKVSIAV
jgi:coproporphyrinogen III oxidase-like Fe-S oxidoreductase